MSEPNESFYVQIVEIETDIAVETMGPMPEWRAEKVERGIQINMNHEKYFTDVISHGYLNDRTRLGAGGPQ